MASHFGLEKIQQFQAVSTEVLGIIGAVCLICFLLISYSVKSILRRRTPRYILSTNRHDVGTQTSISHRTDPRNLSGAAFLHPSSGMSSVRSNEVPADYSLVGDSREESLRTSSDIWRVTNYEGPSGINPLRVSSGQSARTSSEMFRVNSYEDPADNNRLRVSRPGNRRPTRRMWGGNRHYVDPTANNPIGDSGEETRRTTSTMWSETGNENPTGNNHHRSEIYMRRMVGDPEE